jgi:ubiquinone/menaquinone biosynthesis C-methylase UbiE
VVVSKWAIQTSPEIEPIYKEVARVLKPNGAFLFLACHPLRQFLEKKKHPKDYFKKEMVESILFGGKVVVQEPSHTMNEYLSPFFFEHFRLQGYFEGFDDAIEMVDGDTYPGFSIFRASRK